MEDKKEKENTNENVVEKTKELPDTKTEENKDIKKDMSKENAETNTMTMSTTKMSTDQLICKSPQGSSSASAKSAKVTRKLKHRHVLYLGVLQVFLGFFMMVFGIFVILHKASLSQIGGGIWGGLLSMVTGISGILAAADSLCPFKSAAQRVAHTVFLALSLISLAIAQLVVVITATGVARDIYKTGIDDVDEVSGVRQSQLVDAGRLAIPFAAGLIATAALECICAAVAAYRSARDVCPCFQRGQGEEHYVDNLRACHSHAIVSSWLMGKQPQEMSPPTVYLVAPPSSLGGSKLSSGMGVTPMYAIPAPLVPRQVMGYPLIPAPLGPVPSPIIPPTPTRREIHHMQKRYIAAKGIKPRSRTPTPRRSRSKSKSMERQVSEEDVAKTYTGLDRTIAEEFIDMCDSKNTSICSNSSCSSSSCSCQSSCSCSSNSHAGCSSSASRDYLINKV